MVNYDEVKNHLVDELNDVLKYLDMSKQGNNELEKQIFKDIACDERSHAKYLKHILDSHSDIKLSTDELELWNNVEEAAKSV